MKVFISWSGETSKKIAEIINEWLPTVIQSVETYFSPNDIEKGEKWDSVITKNLNESEIGIVCLTKSNLNSPWILFEAGALSNHFDKTRVCPILFGLNNSDLTGPLSTFQTTNFTKSDLKKLIETINNQLGKLKLKENILEKSFEKFYPELEKEIKSILEEEPKEKSNYKQRTEKEILEEILDLTRKQYYRPRTMLGRMMLTKENDFVRKEELISEIIDLILDNKNLVMSEIDFDELIEQLSYYEVIRSIAINKDELISIVENILKARK